MTWQATLYLKFADAATGQAALLSALGVTANPDGSVPSDGAKYVLVAPITEWITPPSQGNAGTLQPGWWAMIRFNDAWPGWQAANTALAPYKQTVSSPDAVFA